MRRKHSVIKPKEVSALASKQLGCITKLSFARLAEFVPHGMRESFFDRARASSRRKRPPMLLEPIINSRNTCTF